MFIFGGRGGNARIKEAGKKCYMTSNNGGCKSIPPAHDRNRPILYGCDSHPPPLQSGARLSPVRRHRLPAPSLMFRRTGCVYREQRPRRFGCILGAMHKLIYTLVSAILLYSKLY